MTTHAAHHQPPLGEPDPDVINTFRGRWAFLSNFHPATLVWEGITYPTSEHAFNAGKSTSPETRHWIADAETPSDAKARGRRVPLRPGWDERIRFQVMRDVLAAKFTARPARIAALLSTGGATLIEGNTWHDNVWGDCRCGCPACAEPGQNHLGRLLMELRAELAAAQAPPDPVDVLASLIEAVRSRPGLTGSDTLAAAILDAGYQPPIKERHAHHR